MPFSILIKSPDGSILQNLYHLIKLSGVQVMKTISKKLKIAEKDNNLWHLGAIKGNKNESIFKITDETSRKQQH